MDKILTKTEYEGISSLSFKRTSDEFNISKRAYNFLLKRKMKNEVVSENTNLPKVKNTTLVQMFSEINKVKSNAAMRDEIQDSKGIRKKEVLKVSQLGIKISQKNIVVPNRIVKAYKCQDLKSLLGSITERHKRVKEQLDKKLPTSNNTHNKWKGVKAVKHQLNLTHALPTRRLNKSNELQEKKALPLLNIPVMVSPRYKVSNTKHIKRARVKSQARNSPIKIIFNASFYDSSNAFRAKRFQKIPRLAVCHKKSLKSPFINGWQLINNTDNPLTMNTETLAVTSDMVIKNVITSASNNLKLKEKKCLKLLNFTEFFIEYENPCEVKRYRKAPKIKSKDRLNLSYKKVKVKTDNCLIAIDLTSGISKQKIKGAKSNSEILPNSVKCNKKEAKNNNMGNSYEKIIEYESKIKKINEFLNMKRTKIIELNSSKEHKRIKRANLKDNSLFNTSIVFNLDNAISSTSIKLP